ncbi:TonB-dependent receptor [Flagellimonas sp. 389]|uniref:TonB-dependent receptor n=1 Tax=Flagellimonas sp. 389 TaxID=2835862 RepID=UPI001BD3AD58|nr:TonB-dependent receptor [Flagellimonas sp. 389]MBS9462212.1 TonB-dependent receptor [Flagellimonas sp. 389]
MNSQLQIKGVVMGIENQEKEILLSNVNVFWLGSTIGTVTNEQGQFSIPYQTEFKKLVVQYIGYRTDTIYANRPNLGIIRLRNNTELEEVVVRKKVNPLQKSLFDVQNVVTVNSREMLKAACCNLSESFETNPSVDVNISDAITGAKQIQMLGLNSPYLLFTQENMPSIRGASQIYGLSFVPGSWIESIQITKGAGNVLNGFESISGQINTELVKPFTDKRFFLNLYANNFERYEFNTRYNHIISEKWATGLYLHGNLRNGEIDRNTDSFLDTPLANQVNVMNRWQYLDTEKGWVGFLNLQFLDDEKQTGQVLFNPSTDRFTSNAWGSEVNTQRLDVSGKVGYVFPELPYQSIGFQAAYSDHKQDSYYGLNEYDILHRSFYSNAIFNSILGSTQHKFKTGVSFTYDVFDENVNGGDLQRTDNSLGTFFEYTYDSLEKLSLVAGLRLDHGNRLSTFITPRLHMRYSLWDKASLRGSVGKGKRAANIFSENQQLFASARQINIIDNGGSIYGLNPEVAWNFGAGFVQKLYVWNRTMELSLDFYRTSFQNQVIIDWENPREISFYNLIGKSYANSFQFDFNYEIVQNLDLRATYKNYDVMIDYLSERLQKPLQPEHRVFLNLNYETLKKSEGAQWRIDFTFNWLGKQRIPSTELNPIEFRFSDFSPSFSILNFQVTRVFSNQFEVYLGGENITNYTQNIPILGSDDPFGSFFDSTLSFAPVLEATYYLGLRYKINTD